MNPPTPFPVSVDLRRLKGMTSDGTRIAVECETDVGWFEIATRAYVRAGRREDVIAADGARILIARGNELLAIGPDRVETKVANLPPSSMRRTLACSPRGGLCAILSWGGATAEIRLLRGDALEAPWRPEPGYAITDLAVRADHKAIAYVGSAREITVHHLATGADAPWPLPDAASCAFSVYGNWSSADGSLIVSQTCGKGGSRLVQLHGPGRGATTVYTTEDEIAGFAVAGSDVFLNERHRAADLVVVDDL